MSERTRSTSRPASSPRSFSCASASVKSPFGRELLRFVCAGVAWGGCEGGLGLVAVLHLNDARIAAGERRDFQEINTYDQATGPELARGDLGPASGRAAQFDNGGTRRKQPVLLVHLEKLEGSAAAPPLLLRSLDKPIVDVPIQPRLAPLPRPLPRTQVPGARARGEAPAPRQQPHR